MELPETGMSRDAVFERLNAYKENDVDWRSGRVWGYVYDPGEDVLDVGKRAFMSYLSENALDPTAFPSILRLENEVIALARAQLRGDDKVVGNFTSGGTESIICAMKAARDWARDTKPQITKPELILPKTAHAAFQKAAHYLDIATVLVDVDRENGFVADVAAMEAAITENTIALVGSAISYAHGTIDPIPELGALAEKNDLWLHVDACVGGWLLPYFRRLGVEMVDFDFTVPGVKSISMDLHKYAFCPKGASTVLYRDKGLRRYQIFTCTTWTGYSIVNPTVQSSKSGGPVAAAWAVLNYVGDEGYLELARQSLEATRAIASGIEAIDGLYLLAKPDMNLVSFGAEGVNVFQLSDLMKARGWVLQPQFAYGGSEENLHLSVNPASAKWVSEFCEDLAECTIEARQMKSSGLAKMVQAAFAAIDPDKLSPEMFQQMLAMGGMGGVEVPTEMAEINETLNALPVALRSRLLTEFLNELFEPAKA